MIREPTASDIPVAPTRRRLPWGWLAAATLVALLAWAATQFIGGAQLSVSAERLRIAPVTRGPFVSDITTQGRIVAARSPTLYAPALGTVSLDVLPGDAVDEGQVVARLDSPALTSELARADADLQGLKATYARERLEVETQRLQNQQAVDLAKVTVDAAERELDRSQRAHEQGLLPIMDVDRRSDELATALVHYHHAQAEAELQDESLDFQLQSRLLEVDRQQLVVDDARRRVDELQVRAPVAGIVGNVLVDQRAAVAANAPLLTVVDLSAMEVEIQIPETYADALALDMPADIRVGGRNFAGHVTAISPEVQDNQVTGRVRFDDAAPAELRQNQRVSVSVLLDSREDVLQLPRGSFVETGGGRHVYVVRDGVAQRTPVETGAIAVDRVEILSGLNAGDRVVISGDQGFDDADRVRIRD